MKELLNYSIAGNTLIGYLIFSAFIIASIILVKLFRIIIFSRVRKMTESTESLFDDLIADAFKKNIIPVMYTASFYFCFGLLNLSAGIERWAGYLLFAAFIFFLTRFIISTGILFIKKFWLKEDKTEEESSISILISTIIKITVWSVSVLILLDNIGVKISGLIAGLGVGGVAIAFAAQSILRDFFNYFTIFFDRPFEIGDFLVIDKFAGVVEHIGIKTTRIRSLGGELLIFANTDLTGSRLRNYKSMQERRVVFSFGVTYQTPARKLKQIPAEIEKTISAIEMARFDRAHFHKFGDSSLDFEVVYYILSGDYKIYMDTQQEINIKIMLLLEKMKVDFAYPTRTVYIEKA